MSNLSEQLIEKSKNGGQKRKRESCVEFMSFLAYFLFSKSYSGKPFLSDCLSRSGSSFGRKKFRQGSGGGTTTNTTPSATATTSTSEEQEEEEEMKTEPATAALVKETPSSYSLDTGSEHIAKKKRAMFQV